MLKTYQMKKIQEGSVLINVPLKTNKNLQMFNAIQELNLKKE